MRSSLGKKRKAPVVLTTLVALESPLLRCGSFRQALKGRGFPGTEGGSASRDGHGLAATLGRLAPSGCLGLPVVSVCRGGVTVLVVTQLSPLEVAEAFGAPRKALPLSCGGARLYRPDGRHYLTHALGALLGEVKVGLGMYSREALTDERLKGRQKATRTGPEVLPFIAV